MKRYITLLIIFFTGGYVYGQQVPQYSQYIWNSYLINPAIGGAEKYLDFRAGYRNQWVGLEGAPRTFTFTMNGQVGKKLINREDTDVVNRQRGPKDRKPVSKVGKLMGFKKRKYPTSPGSYRVRPHHGVGVQLMSDWIGPFSTLGVYGSYAYHIPITKEIYASAGAFVGIKQYNVSVNRMTFTVPGDNALGNLGDLRGLAPDGMLGLMVYAPKFYVGMSVNQIFSNELSFRTELEQITGQAHLTPHMFGMAGYRIKLTDEIAVVPSTMVRYLHGTMPAVDLTMKFNYMDILWAGGSLRAGDAMVFLLGFSYNNKIDFMYSYDHTTSGLRRHNSGTHEVVVGFRMVNKPTTGCKPSYVW
ncbi:type IX secretion system membrane protein PorP/SprF [Cytophagaceae bacterium ABcell3]|nr:type IX secretion system membrane protein PorP/SprF [Cytophagaceae bacterium ABcell3]